MQDQTDSFVVMFFRTNSGELRCRVTAVASRQTWIADRATDLRQLLVEQHTQPREGGGTAS
jgi:hypothetical protein